MAMQYPASMTLQDVKHACPAFGIHVCPFSNLPEEKKGLAAKCPAFEKGCPFKTCKSVGEFQEKLAEMRDKCKGVAAYVEFHRALVRTAMQKEIDLGRQCPVFKTKAGCPFAQDTKGKPIVDPDYVVSPWRVSWDDIMFKCPAFGKGLCPYTGLVAKAQGMAASCPAFKEGCPYKGCKTVGEVVEKLSQMRDHCKGKAAYQKFLEMLASVDKDGEKKLGMCPFNAHVCPFSFDAEGKPIVPK